jgi:hypothetical protein
MGRVTEFIDYINRKREPSDYFKSSEYHYISFTDKLVKIAKQYRKNMKYREKMKIIENKKKES